MNNVIYFQHFVIDVQQCMRDLLVLPHLQTGLEMPAHRSTMSQIHLANTLRFMVLTQGQGPPVMFYPLPTECQPGMLHVSILRSDPVKYQTPPSRTRN